MDPIKTDPRRSGIWHTIWMNIAVFLGLGLAIFFLIPIADLIGKAGKLIRRARCADDPRLLPTRQRGAGA